jgi:hypothetical protein
MGNTVKTWGRCTGQPFMMGRGHCKIVPRGLIERATGEDYQRGLPGRTTREDYPGGLPGRTTREDYPRRLLGEGGHVRAQSLTQSHGSVQITCDGPWRSPTGVTRRRPERTTRAGKTCLDSSESFFYAHPRMRTNHVRVPAEVSNGPACGSARVQGPERGMSWRQIA